MLRACSYALIESIGLIQLAALRWKERLVIMVKDHVYGGKGKQWLLLVAMSALALLLLGISLLPGQRGNGREALTVYCAASLRLPVEAAAKQYQEEFGTPVRLDYGSSGAMESRLRQDVSKGLGLCDIFIPADDSFAWRCQNDGVTEETIPLAAFVLVYATPHKTAQPLQSLTDILSQHQQIAVCDVSAAAGKKTMEALEASSYWQGFQDKELRSAATVVEAAGWIRDTDVIEGGFIWNTTALQHGLHIHDITELADMRSTIVANVSSGSKQPARALHFIRYLQAPEKGARHFADQYFVPVQGDLWADVPELVLYAGGLYRDALKDIINAFEEREGVNVQTRYGACAMLVSDMRALQDMAAMPDAFLTCDASSMDKVSNNFGRAIDVSSTRMVIMVPKGNPKNIQSLSDLARKDVRAATANPSFSALGDRSWQLLGEFGIDRERGRERQIAASAATAHDLILQMQNDRIFDCALVYRANAMHLQDRFDLIDIEHPRALAVQNMAAGTNSRYPWLTRRLMARITEPGLRQHFIRHGFNALEAKTDVDE